MIRNRKKLWLLVVVISLAVILSYLLLGGSRIQIAGLRCEYRINPAGIDETRPRLSWVVDADENQRGVLQAACQVLVASSQQLLDENQGDLWDSGKMDSDQSVQVVYGGKNLVSGQSCFWKDR